MSEPQRFRQLSLPTGTETLQLQEAARHRRISRTLEDLYFSWGYDPAETALVDFFDVYRPLLPDGEVKQIYRAVDRQGEILALRSDITLFLAKQLGLHLTAGDLPVRVFYDDQIVRAEDRLDISHNEYSQSGVELVGLPGAEAEAEVLLLAVETMSALEQREAVLHIGSHRLVDAAARSAGVTEGALPEFLSQVRRREFDALEQPELSKILSFIGSPQEFESLQATSKDLPGGIATALTELSQLTTLLLPLLPKTWRERVRIDLSELGHNSYYSGIAFSMFTPKSNSAVLRGGRYDQLLRAFGFDAPSVGFSLFPRKLPSEVLSRTYQTARSAPGKTLAERVAALRSADPTTTRMHL